jgi:hypothetical protein
VPAAVPISYGENHRREGKENYVETRTRGFSVILGVGLFAASTAIATAQQPSITKITQTGQSQSTTSTRVVKATVVSVNGNKVVGEDAAGKATEYTIPEGFKFQFEGREIGVAELKPGMHVSATITTTTTTTPVWVTEIKTGRVLVVSGHNIIVRGPQGNRLFSNKDAEQRNVTVMRNGQQVSLSDLRPGDNFTATIITDEAPRVVSEREVQAIAHAAPQPAAAAAATAPTEAPAAAPAATPSEAPAAAPVAASAEAPAAAPTDAAAAASPPAVAPAAEAPAPASGFPMWLLWLLILIVILVVVFLLRRRKS